MKSTNTSLLLCGTAVLAMLFPPVACAQGQQHLDLNARVSALEEYIESIQPSLTQFTDNVTQGLNAYTEGLSSDLEDYTRRLETNMDQQLRVINNKRIILQLEPNSYSKIETGSGSFLIAFQQIQAVPGGYQLHLQIGNPNFADYKDAKLTVFWDGQGTSGESQLNGAEYAISGILPKGTWSPVKINLIPAAIDGIRWIECEMEVASVILQNP